MRVVVTRAERHVQVSGLKAEGLTFGQIAAHLGLCKSTVTAAYYDPTGEGDRERKSRNAPPCADCGKPLSTSGSVVNVQERCRGCEGARVRGLSRQWILDSFREWAQAFGVAPSSMDWNPAHARGGAGYCAWKAERYEATGRPWPSPSLVIKHFGSWNEGLRAAGFKTLPKNEHWLGHAGRALREEDERLAA